MTSAYLRWKYGTKAAPAGLPSVANTRPEEYHYNIYVLDVHLLPTIVRIKPSTESSSGAGGLVEHGVIGVSPKHPSLAVSIATLELYRKIRLRKPSFSVESFAKLVCDYYKVRVERFACLAANTIVSSVLTVATCARPSRTRSSRTSRCSATFSCVLTLPWAVIRQTGEFSIPVPRALTRYVARAFCKPCDVIETDECT